MTTNGPGRHPFEYQKPTDKSVEDLKVCRIIYKNLYNLLIKLPESRERSLAITKLEESSMWANKGIVFNQVDPDCEEEQEEKHKIAICENCGETEKFYEVDEECSDEKIKRVPCKKCGKTMLKFKEENKDRPSL